MDQLDIAYCAGVIDSDGHIGVRRSDYRVRVVGDRATPSYFARVVVKQVTPQAVDLLYGLWGGTRRMEDPSAKRGNPLHSWHVHSAAAGRVLDAVLPYLRIKPAQAENALEVCRLVRLGSRRFKVPEVIPGEPMVSVTEAAERLGKRYDVVFQAIAAGTVPFVRGKRNGRKPSVFIPESFLATWAARGHTPSRTPETLAKLDAHFLRGKELNRVGI